MKIRFLFLFLIFAMTVSSTVPSTATEDWNPVSLSPYNVDVIYRQEAAAYIQYVQEEWPAYQLARKSVERLENLITTKYSSKNMNIEVNLGVNDLQPRIKSTIRYKAITVHLVFDYKD